MYALPIQTEQIDRIVLTAQTGAQPGSLEILEFSFHESADEEEQPLFSCKRISASTQVPDNIRFLRIPETPYSLSQLGSDFGILEQRVQCAGIPFQLNTSKSVSFTNFVERDSISLAVGEEVSEVYLLLALHLAGTDGAFGYVPRTEITQPERLIVRKQYEDGTEEESFPFNLSAHAYVVPATMDAYVIPADPSRKLRSITLEERMSYGQIVLAAASVNRDAIPMNPVPVHRRRAQFPDPSN